MASHFRSSFGRDLGVWVRRVARVCVRVERQVVEYIAKTTPRRRASRLAGILLFGCMTYSFLGSNGCDSCYDEIKETTGSADVAEVITSMAINAVFGSAGGKGKVVQSGGLAAPRFTGADGSQTGTASFEGNFTAITQPSSNYFFLGRMADCSLSQILGNSAGSGSATTETATSATTNYERVLHQLAGLTTTPNVFANGCLENTTGISSRVGVLVGRKPGGTFVMAMAEGNGNNNAVFILATGANSAMNLALGRPPVPRSQSSSSRKF